MAFSPSYARDVVLPLASAAYTVMSGAAPTLPPGFSQTALIKADRAHLAALPEQHHATAMAALAVLAAPDVAQGMPPNTLEPRLTTFGCPRVGVADFKAAFDAAIECCYRVVNFLDIVPLVPPAPYVHVGAEIAVDSGGAVGIGWRHSQLSGRPLPPAAGSQPAPRWAGLRPPAGRTAPGTRWRPCPRRSGHARRI